MELLIGILLGGMLATAIANQKIKTIKEVLETKEWIIEKLTKQTKGE